MPIVWIGGVLPKIIEREAGRDYCYARRESNLKHMRCESKSTHQADRGTRSSKNPTSFFGPKWAGNSGTRANRYSLGRK
jgi:hypothetical protein